MSEAEVYRVCLTGAKCSLKYRLDYVARVASRGEDGQGTGDLCGDLEAAARDLGRVVNVQPSDCFDRCPIPGERSNVVGPDARLYRVYFDDLPDLLLRFGGEDSKS